MTKTDITLYQLNVSFADIASSMGTRPLTLSPKKPNLGTDIEVISGYWKRGYACSIEAFATYLKEGQWTMEDSVRYSRPGCDVIGGTSGSPAIMQGTRTVVGVNNTINEDGGRCSINNPCEVDDNGNVVYQRGYGYAQQTFWVYSCLNSNNQLDVTVSGCMLFH